MQCKYCEYENQNEKEFKRHFYHTHFNYDKQVFYCKQCNYEGQPCNEKWTNHGFSDRKASFLGHLKSKEHLNEGKSFTCDKCNFSTKFKASLTNHLKSKKHLALF